MPGMPDTSTAVADARALLGDDPLEAVAAGLLVVPAGHAAARRGARHRADAENRALVQGTQAGHGGLLAPDAVLLPDHPRPAAAAVVAAAGRAVARRGARHRGEAGVAGHLAQAGHVDPLAPDAVLLADQERHVVTAVIVGPAGGAVARRGARHRVNRPAPWDVQVAGDFLVAPPAAIPLPDHEHIVP